MSLLTALIKLDIAVMRVLGGKSNETLSAAAWNGHINNGWFGWTYLLIDLLFYPLQRDHCKTDWTYRKGIYQ